MAGQLNIKLLVASVHNLTSTALRFLYMTYIFVSLYIKAKNQRNKGMSDFD